VPLSPVLTRTDCLTRTSTSWTCLRGEAPARARKEKAAEKKEFGAAHVDDTTRDNAFPTKAESPVGYIEDAQIRTEDKCRSGMVIRVMDIRLRTPTQTPMPLASSATCDGVSTCSVACPSSVPHRPAPTGPRRARAGRSRRGSPALSWIQPGRLLPHHDSSISHRSWSRCTAATTRGQRSRAHDRVVCGLSTASWVSTLELWAQNDVIGVPPRGSRGAPNRRSARLGPTN
jgi:hypothetical protein